MKTPDEIKTAIDTIINSRALCLFTVADLLGTVPQSLSSNRQILSMSDVELRASLNEQVSDAIALESIKAKLSQGDLAVINKLAGTSL